MKSKDIYKHLLNLVYKTEFGQRMLLLGNEVCNNIYFEVPYSSFLYSEYGIIKVYFYSINKCDFYTNMSILNLNSIIPFCNKIYIISKEGKYEYTDRRLFKNNLYKQIVSCPLLENNHYIFKIDLSNLYFTLREVSFQSIESFASILESKCLIYSKSYYLLDAVTFDSKNMDSIQYNIEILKEYLLKFMIFHLDMRTEKVFILTFTHYIGENADEILNKYKPFFEEINKYICENLSVKESNKLLKNRITVYYRMDYVDEDGVIPSYMDLNYLSNKYFVTI